MQTLPERNDGSTSAKDTIITQEATLLHSWPRDEITGKAGEAPAKPGVNTDILSGKEGHEEAPLIAELLMQLNKAPLMMDLASGPNALLCKAFALGFQFQ